MAENSLTILGSCSGLPRADRATAGYLLKTGESLSLIDCGGGVTSSFLRRGYDPLKVDRAFITHTHPDHVCDLPLFIQLIYLKGRQEPFDIYVPEEFVDPFRTYLNAVYLIPEKLPFEINLTGMADGFVFDGQFKLTATANNHLGSHAELIEQLGLSNRMQCFSFLIEAGGRSLLYSSDVASFDDIRGYLDDIDIAIIESTHIDLNHVISSAAKAKVGQYVISHLGTDEEIAAINRIAAKTGLDNLNTAMDGMVLDL